MGTIRKVVLLQIGAKVAYYRKLNKLSQKELSAAIHVSTSVLSRIERGDYNGNLSLDVLFNIGEALGVDPSVFITFTPYEKSLWKGM